MRQRSVVYTLFALFLVLCWSAFTTSQNDEVEFVGSAVWTRAHDATIVGDLAFSSFINGLAIFDLSDIQNPTSFSFATITPLRRQATLDSQSSIYRTLKIRT